MPELNFKCPDCGNTSLEEVMVNTVQSSTVTDADKLSNGAVALEYGLWDVDGGEVSHYQCAHCGFSPKDRQGRDISHPDPLYDWLEEKNMLAEEEDVEG